MLAVGTVAAVAICAAGAAGLDRAFPPDLSRLASHGTTIRDRHGDVLAVRPAPGGVWRFDTDAEAVPPQLIDMLIATEDARFRWHPGVDPLAAFRAAGQMVFAGHVVSGGSTLTMQVARLLEPKPRGIAAKASESFRALQLTARYSKRQILGMWLSLAPFGGNLVGVEAASRAWFGKPANRSTRRRRRCWWPSRAGRRDCGPTGLRSGRSGCATGCWTRPSGAAC